MISTRFYVSRGSSQRAPTALFAIATERRWPKVDEKASSGGRCSGALTIMTADVNQDATRAVKVDGDGREPTTTAGTQDQI